MREHLAFLGAHPVHQPGDSIRPEQPHQIVFQREEELRCPRITLPAGAAAELAIDAPRLVTLRADDVEAAALHYIDDLILRVLALGRLGLGDAWSELNVSSTAGHVGGDGNG